MDDDAFGLTAALPHPDVVKQRIASAEPRAALERAAPMVSFVAEPKSEIGPHVSTGTSEVDMDLVRAAVDRVNPQASSTLAQNEDSFSHTSALPRSEAIQRLIEEADPRAAMARAATTETIAKSARPAAKVSDHEPTGTAAVDMDLVREAVAAAARRAGSAAPREIALLAAIAADIRRGTMPREAVAARGLSDGEWRRAQADVVNDPAKRALFDQEVQRLLAERK